MREKLVKGLSALIGAGVSWPTVTRSLGTLPDYGAVALYGAGVGFILGLVLQTTKAVEAVIAKWHGGWRLLLLIAAIAGWLYASYFFYVQYQLHGASAGAMTADRLHRAQFAVGSLSVLWSTALSYAGAAIAEAIENRKPPTP
ncbi:hypothetical protein VLK31_22730 [Variovorax sp. H27-G14]|uniref:hypothetical protein n=1 Tax=Variovorax sp. H27-G14 TaxID=3111914 RepID=UPI0038FC3857